MGCINLLSISSTEIDNVLGFLRDRSTEEWVLLPRLEDVQGKMLSLHVVELLVIRWH